MVSAEQWTLVEREVEKAGGVDKVDGYTGVLLRDAIAKASFGGDRSAAGRHAANIRWQGHSAEVDIGADMGYAGGGGKGDKMTVQNPRKMLTGSVSVLGSTYKITTSKNLKVGDEVLVQQYHQRWQAPNDPPRPLDAVQVVIPSLARKLTEKTRTAKNISVMTVTKVDERTKRVHLDGTTATLNIARTTTCVVKVQGRGGSDSPT